MMKKIAFCILVLSVLSCNQEPSNITEPVKPTLSKPHEDLGQLFIDIQMAGLYPDSKTFVDAEPKYAPDSLIAIYESLKQQEGFDLKQFVETYFTLPASGGASADIKYRKELKSHLVSHWDYLTREPDSTTAYTSLIPLQKSYIVPGGRFREIYYWDSFFTIVGLAASDRWDMVGNMTDNFAGLIDEVGFIPNGNRSYYLSRSQPPFFSLMVNLIMRKKGKDEGLQYLPQL